MNPSAALERRSWLWILPVLVACAMGMALALLNRPFVFVAVLAGTAGYVCFAWASVRQPLLLVVVMLLVLEFLPPLYFDALGDTPVYVSFFLIPILLAIFAFRSADLRLSWDPIGKGIVAFLAGTALSIPFAFCLSGTSTGFSSISRWILLGHIAPIYFLIRGFRPFPARRILSLLLCGAVLSALYGIVDFVWPIPLPHPSADQFIWLEGLILRRAQGPFYESSNFANFCGFFLIAAAAALLARRERDLGVTRWLLVVFVSILSLGVLVAFSRSAWASIFVALLSFLTLSRFVRLPRAIAVLFALLVPLCFLWAFSPGLWDYLVDARLGHLFEILQDPNSVTSGRFETWSRVLTIMRDEPQYLFFGIGYKTLPVTRLFHGEIITDNGYLSLLLECGIAGLAGFVLWSRAIFKTFFRVARSVSRLSAFWATVLFSIWCGELVQLLATDAQTYWRNLSVLVALMAITLNVDEQSKTAERSV